MTYDAFRNYDLRFEPPDDDWRLHADCTHDETKAAMRECEDRYEAEADLQTDRRIDEMKEARAR